MRFLVVLASILAAASAVPGSPQRIVGGSPAPISQYTSIAALLYTRDWSAYLQECAGSILNSRSILTAAHCVEFDVVARWRVRVGSAWANTGGSVLNSQQFIIHPDFNTWTLDSDIAIIRTDIITFVSNAVQPASIAGSTYTVPDNTVVVAAGWGQTSWGGQQSEQLLDVQVWTVNQEICRTRYSTLRYTVTGNMLCSGWLDVGGRDQCQGDSGGPLYHNNVVLGICSWGEQCAMPDYPGVNTRVSNFVSWIQTNA